MPRRPSPALVISLIALFVALGGSGYAATRAAAPLASGGKKHKPKPKTTTDTAADTRLFKKLAVTASVAHAKTADSATSAGTANSANSANTANSANAANTANSANTANTANTANSANTANTANSATTAGTASNADALGGLAPTAYQTVSNILFATVKTGASGGTLVRGRGATGVTRLGAGDYAVTFDKSVANCTWIATAGEPDATPADAVIAVVRAVSNSTPNEVEVFTFNSFSDAAVEGQGFHLAVFCP